MREFFSRGIAEKNPNTNCPLVDANVDYPIPTNHKYPLPLSISLHLF